MRSGQGKPGAGMVERGPGPGAGVVATGTGSREPCLRVIRIGGRLVVFQVARRTIGRRACKTPVRMALRALQGCVHSGQGKSHEIVIEAGRRPRRRGMALLAGRRESRLHVIRIARLLEILQVTSDASRRRSLVAIASVAGRAVQSCMRPAQRESRDL